MKNKRGGDKILSVYWFAILFIVAAAIVYMAALFYGAPYDVRGIESEILTNKIADCLSQGGYLNENVLESDFESNFLEECNLNFNVEDVYGWGDSSGGGSFSGGEFGGGGASRSFEGDGQEQYYVEVEVYEFDQDSSEGIGEDEILKIVEGNVNLKTAFLFEQSGEKTKREVDTVVIHYTETVSVERTIDIIKRRKLGVQYILGKDGTIMECKNKEVMRGEGKIGGELQRCVSRESALEVEAKWEDSVASHCGCCDVEGWCREICEGDKPKEGEECCVNYNERSIGVEIVNLGKACGDFDICENRIEEGGEIWEVYPEEQIDALVDLVSGIVTRYNIPIDREHIIGHEEINTFKPDPGLAFPWVDFMKRLEYREILSPGMGSSFYVTDRNNNQYVIKIFTLVGKTEKNAA